MTTLSAVCPVCASPSVTIGQKAGVRTGRLFHIHRCPSCEFTFVANPWTDYAAIYDESYYAGQGSDPLVDYAFEYSSPAQTIRKYEWAGITRVVDILAPQARHWLDFGCGNGGLVRYAAAIGKHAVSGFDTGAWADRARQDGLPILLESELPTHNATFDVITAIEVIEHVVDPIGFLRQIRQLAKPGALLFLTTQNTANAPAKFVDWGYVIPEIHVSFFSPRSLACALEKSGFEPFYPGMVPGWDQIIRFKILKNLGARRIQFWERMMPWRTFAPAIGRRYGYHLLPLGIAR